MARPGPAAFLAHGAPTLALDSGGYAAAVRALAARAGPLRAIVVVSAHWEAPEVRVGTAAEPRTIHDFGGFPDELYRIRYPARGAPDLAARAVELLASAGIRAVADPERGLDHGAWVPLRLGWPDAAVPVIPVSLPFDRDAAAVLALGAALAPLREDRVLVLGSGGIVHNLATVDFAARGERPPEWAAAFDAWVAGQVERGDAAALAAWRERAPHAEVAAPSAEHLDPLLFALGAAAGDPAERIYDGWQLGTLSLRSFVFGPRG